LPLAAGFAGAAFTAFFEDAMVRAIYTCRSHGNRLKSQMY